MARTLDTLTLTNAARDYARMWLQPNRKANSSRRWADGPNRVMQDLYNATYKDEHEFLVDAIKGFMGVETLKEFEARAKETFAPREDAVFKKLLERNLAIDPVKGDHIEGAIGKVQVGTRPIRRQMFEVEALWSIRRRKALGLPIHVKGRTDRETIQVVRLLTWPVYAGEAMEREAGSRRPDELPEDAMPTLPDGRRPGAVGAANPNISIESCLAALNAIVDSVDEGSTAATIRIRTGTQPADPDATEDGTLLATLTMSDPAFGAAADDSPGGLATADTITDDSSADATNTATYFRIGATGTGADDHIDGSVGTSDADLIVNTTSFVSGAVISISSLTVALSQGASAS